MEEDSKVPVTPPTLQTEEAAKETKIEPAADAVSPADKATSNTGSVADKATKSEPDMNKVVGNIDAMNTSLEKLFTLHTDIKDALLGAAGSFQSIANGTGQNTISLNEISTKITTLVDRPAVNPVDVTAICENVKTILARPAVTTAEVAAISAGVETLLSRPTAPTSKNRWGPWLRAAIIIAVLGTIVLVRTCSGTPRGAAAAGLTNNVSGALPASAAPNVSAPTQAAPIPAPAPAPVPAPAPKARRVIIQNVITGKVTTIDPDGSTNNDAVVVSSSTQAQTVIVDNRLSGLSNCFNNLSNVQINFGTGNNNNKGNAVGNTIVVQPVIVHLPPTQILRGPPHQGAPALPPAQQAPTNAPAPTPAPQAEAAPVHQTESVANQVGNAPTSTMAPAKNQMPESSASSGGFSSVTTVQGNFVQLLGTIYAQDVNSSYVVPAGSGHTGPQ